ncbi:MULTISPECIES: class I SAM-dependent methyltransferase [Mycobacteroides]|nr:class I SAM-dependent methyltransferase [Mycobacteroides abscessus]
MPTVDRSDFLAMTCDGYDRTAAAYAERFHHHLDDKPLDLAMLNAFAALVAATPNHRIIDVGCGTGATTAILSRQGVQAFGIDLSPNMISQAQRLNPDLSFCTGSMLDLEVPDADVGGVCAWYSTIHIPDEHLDNVFDEFHRVLIPGGLLLLAFQVGDEPRVLREAFGQEVKLTFFRRQPGDVSKRLDRAGLHRHAELVRAPDSDGFESTPHAYVIARKDKN